jgi:hypothetical protein
LRKKKAAAAAEAAKLSKKFLSAHPLNNPQGLFFTLFFQ